ncbi:unnamed protein product [Acanthoscelides obtectus]|uniref:RanBP2-type domain-containing protein n=1 Tax=Acanthoscelides obtectus TaxID=200917 RepID=A0A9P0Q9W8_ACAOB|nr:unnamed protein product [Acanthoscelides obtectus]CAK1623157.1 hypothetical protein AOBTE_LOCUS1841 [Acanthoscelides obtectus]
MGTIASVLQWHCTFCSLINPTERQKCIRCGRARVQAPPKKLSPTFSTLENRNCTVIKKLKSDFRRESNQLTLAGDSSETKTQPSDERLKKCLSLPSLQTLKTCEVCHIFYSTSTVRCILCDRKMNLTESPCKICSLTPVENYRNYDILNCDRPPICKCQRNKSLSLIKSLSCSVAQSSEPSIEAHIPKNIRTTASGISESSNYMWGVKNVLPKGTWTCKQCTLLNSAGFAVCEACENPYTPDFNSNVKPSVFIKVRTLYFIK